MLNLETISTILDDFGGAPVSVQAEHCLNARHKDAGCTLCADACPTDAIELQLGRPRLALDRCVSCGLCLHHCPTDVFTQRGAPEMSLAQTISLISDSALSLVCPQHGGPASAYAPVTTVVRHKRCLASLSVSRLLELADSGRRIIWLDDSPCAECPIGRAQPAIAQTAKTTNYLLQAFGRPPAIRTHLSNSDELHDEPNPRPVVDGDRPEVSRRSFFGALGQLTRRTAATAIVEALPAPIPGGTVPVDQRLPHWIPATRERLYSQLKHLGAAVDVPIKTAGIPFADVNVDGDACSACALCARFCPTGALSFVANTDSFVLYFRSTTCIDCEICAVACPEDAVSFGPRLEAVALIDNERRPLVAGHLAPCVGCHEPTAAPIAEAVEPRCYVCRQGTDPVSPLRDSAGLIADLVQRLPDGNSPIDDRLED
ncbi:MAG: 4Fe-4S binding protein [Anaerolineae bacterium]